MDLRHAFDTTSNIICRKSVRMDLSTKEWVCPLNRNYTLFRVTHQHTLNYTNQDLKAALPFEYKHSLNE